MAMYYTSSFPTATQPLIGVPQAAGAPATTVPGTGAAAAPLAQPEPLAADSPLGGAGSLLSQAATRCSETQNALQQIRDVLLNCSGATAVFRLVLQHGQWVITEHASESGRSYSDLSTVGFGSAAQAAMAEHQAIQLTVRRGIQNAEAVFAPVPLPGRPAEVIGVVWYNDPPHVDTRLLVTQLAAATLVQLHQAQDEQQSRTATMQAAALVELVLKLQRAETLDQSASKLVHLLQEYLGARQVALGWLPRPGKPCQVKAISGLRKIDAHAELTRAFAAALDETLLKGECIAWSASDEASAPGTMALSRLAAMTNNDSILGVRLTVDSRPVGALVVLSPTIPRRPVEQQRFLNVSAPVLAGCMQQLHRGQRSILPRRWRSWCSRKPALRYVLAACALAAALILAMPWPHRVAAPCQLEPVERRFVSAPFASTLEYSNVVPGDRVSEGQVLAVLDGRELRWESSALEAEYNRAEKQRDVALVRGESAASQQAALELQRLQSRRDLIAHRMANLEIRSPIDGMIVAGDLSKAQYAPVDSGQKLFEVAPLEAMVAEVAIPESEISYLQVGQQVRLTIDAWPRRAWTGTIATIRPRAEQRDGRTVFIAEVLLDNDAGQLRPGMSGRAKVTAGRRPVGWLLFHKPFEALTRFLQ